MHAGRSRYLSEVVSLSRLQQCTAITTHESSLGIHGCQNGNAWEKIPTSGWNPQYSWVVSILVVRFSGKLFAIRTPASCYEVQWSVETTSSVHVLPEINQKKVEQFDRAKRITAQKQGRLSASRQYRHLYSGFLVKLGVGAAGQQQGRQGDSQNGRSAFRRTEFIYDKNISVIRLQHPLSNESSDSFWSKYFTRAKQQMTMR